MWGNRGQTGMFRGSSSLSLDAKGRMAIPARYREALLRTGDGSLVVTIAYAGHCLWLYTVAEWEQIERKLIKLSDLNDTTYRLKHALLAPAHECEPDANGRILLPAALRDAVGIDKQVQLIGMGNKFEVWQQAAWERRFQAHLEMARDGGLEIPEELANLSL